MYHENARVRGEAWQTQLLGGSFLSVFKTPTHANSFLGLPLLPPPHPCRTHDNMHLVHVLLCVVFTTTHSISHRSRIHRTNKITSTTTSANQWVATKLVTTNEPREGTTDTTKQSISVLYHEQHYHIVEGATTSPEELHKLVATGSYTDSIGSAGWGGLEITTYPNHEDERQMYAAGLAEGYLTNTRIRQLYINDVSLRTDQSLTGLYRYFEIQDRYLRSYAKGGSNHVKGSLFWKHVALEMAQLDGLTDGYNYGADEPNQLVLGDLWLLNMDGDVIDLERGVTQGLVDITENIKEPVVLADLVGGSLRGNANDPPSLLETKTTTTTVDTSSSAVGASSTSQTSFPLPSWSPARGINLKSKPKPQRCRSWSKVSGFDVGAIYTDATTSYSPPCFPMCVCLPIHVHEPQPCWSTETTKTKKTRTKKRNKKFLCPM